MPRIEDVRETVQATFWDTLSADEVAHGVMGFTRHTGDRSLTNMAVSGMLPGDGSFRVQEIVLAAPRGVLPSWAGIHWQFFVGSKSQFEQPVWLPPDTVERYNKDAGSELLASVTTPVDWECLVWLNDIFISPRQAFWFAFGVYGAKPTGSVRFAIRGDWTRDVV